MRIRSLTRWCVGITLVMGALWLLGASGQRVLAQTSAASEPDGQFRVYLPVVQRPANCEVGQFRAEYFPNRTLSGPPLLVRCEEEIDFRWGLGGPGGGIGSNNFSVRWKGRFDFDANQYTFVANTNDGMRIWLDGENLLDKWFEQSETEYRVTRSISDGEHELVVEYFEAQDEAVAQVRWEVTGCPLGQFRAEYFPNRELQGNPVFVRCEERIDQNWGAGGPGNGVGNDNFSVRWSGRFPVSTGTYTFVARTDDGMRIWLDGTQILNEWRDQGLQEYRVTRALTAGEHELRVEYYERAGGALAQVTWGLDCPVDQFRAEYFNNRTLSGPPTFSRCEASVNQNWGTGGPGNGVGNDNFSVRWTGRIAFEAGTYTFVARTDDGMRVWLDGTQILDEWRNQSAEYRVTLPITAGEHELRVEYYEATGGALASLTWARQCPTGQFYAEYFPNRTLSGAPTFTRCEATINQAWGMGGPGNGIGNDDFSVRWTGRVAFTAGNYRFFARTDDGMRIWINDVPILDEWRVQSVREYERLVQLTGSGEYTVRVEYFEAIGEAVARVTWSAVPAPGGEPIRVAP